MALRQVGNPHLAEEITQAVFLILARKAGDLGRETVLAGWLCRTARFTACNALKTEHRRQHGEQEACMESLATEPAPEVWPQIAPLLDEALAQLAPADRNAVVLRYYQQKPLEEVGRVLGLNADTAQKRVSRALDKLRKFFVKRGVALSAAAIGSAVSAHSVQAAPAGLAQTIAAVTLAKGAAAGGSTLTLARGALKLMAWTKAKMAVAVAAGVLLAAGTATVVVEKSVSPTMDEKFWKPENKNFDLIPPVLILRPTRYSNPNTSWKTGTGDGREICLNTYFEGLLGDAYSTRQQRMILPAKIPHKHYDLMLTLHDHQKEALQKELTRQFGITGRREMVETNVLWLQIKNPALLAPHVHQHQKMDFKNGPGLWAWTGFHMDVVAGVLEDMFQQPVIIQAGLADTYDLTLQWGEQDDAKQVVTEKLAQAGLELVPHREPVEMLVVEKVK